MSTYGSAANETAGVVIDEPLRVTDAAALQWDDVADVVVVGLGGAGAAAALEAHERGAEVLVVERFAGGGATAMSGGVFYAGGTRFQQDAGYLDTAEDMFDYLSLERKDAVSEATLRQFCVESADNTEWLVKHGVVFEGSLHRGKTNYPPEGQFLYFSGNEASPAFAATAKPAPRGHRTVGKGLTGYAFFGALKRAMGQSTIRVRQHSRVMRLVVDASGAVLGVETLELPAAAAQRRHQALYAKVDPVRPFNAARAEQAIDAAVALEQQAGSRVRLRARAGVILSTGGFGYNTAMVRQHLPRLAGRVGALMRLGSMGCNGSGIQLGCSVGGAVRGLDRAMLGRMIAPPNALVTGLMVNQQGKRFINEDAYNAVLGNAILQQPNGDAWIILDRELHRKLLLQCIPTGDGTFKSHRLPALLNRLFGGTKRDQTLAGLARKIGVDPATLEMTNQTLGTAIEAGAPDPLGKSPDYCRALGAGPYWALNTSVSNQFAFFVFFTLSGLQVDERSGAVLRGDGTPIGGLYAAGRTAIGIPADGYISGISLADCVFSGRRAGRAAAASRVH